MKKMLVCDVCGKKLYPDFIMPHNRRIHPELLLSRPVQAKAPGISSIGKKPEPKKRNKGKPVRGAARSGGRVGTSVWTVQGGGVSPR